MIRNFLQGRAIRHPLHPMMVHMPVGLWIASFIFDIVYLVGGASLFAGVSYYCMLVATIFAAPAAITGIAEFFSIPKGTHPRRLATTHFTLNVAVTGFYILNLVSRHRVEGGVPLVVTGGEFILSLFSIIILGISGYIGGLLVYNYGIGFKPQLRSSGLEEERPSQTSRRVA